MKIPVLSSLVFLPQYKVSFVICSFSWPSLLTVFLFHCCSTQKQTSCKPVRKKYFFFSFQMEYIQNGTLLCNVQLTVLVIWNSRGKYASPVYEVGWFTTWNLSDTCCNGIFWMPVLRHPFLTVSSGTFTFQPAKGVKWVWEVINRHQIWMVLLYSCSPVSFLSWNTASKDSQCTFS